MWYLMILTMIIHFLQHGLHGIKHFLIFFLSFFFTHELLICPATFRQKCTKHSNASVVPFGALQLLSPVWTGFSTGLQGSCYPGTSIYQYHGNFFHFSVSEPLLHEASSFLFLGLFPHAAEAHPPIASEDTAYEKYFFKALQLKKLFSTCN